VGIGIAKVDAQQQYFNDHDQKLKQLLLLKTKIKAPHF